ncbi:MAG TPA: TlyA family RNA methyltransferase, partial [Firmicutes bacterium]|nr:TlyA family RNA methyltransferase [Bacillota bacterium]
MKLIDLVQTLDIVPDERAARGLIMRGDVLVDGRPVTSPQAEVSTDAEIRLKGQVVAEISRGQRKLEPVLKEAKFDVQGCVSADLGASAGGFTKVLLDHGACRVYAVDVGYGILDLSLRNDPRVIVLERTNARTLTADIIREKLSRVVGDLSFISWRAVLPAVAQLLARRAELLLLVKPQFELAALGRGKELDRGIAVGTDLAGEALRQLLPVWTEHGLAVRGVHRCPVRGTRGNQEYFVHLVDNEG